MPYVEFDVRPGTAKGIARFYREVLGAPAEVIANGNGPAARVTIGTQSSISISARPTRRSSRTTGTTCRSTSPTFSGPYRKLGELGLISMEMNEYEYRFKDIVDLDTREVLFTVEHEVRSQTHPMYAPAAHQPQSGPVQPRLQARPRDHLLGHGVDAAPRNPTHGSATRSGYRRLARRPAGRAPVAQRRLGRRRVRAQRHRLGQPRSGPRHASVTDRDPAAHRHLLRRHDGRQARHRHLPGPRRSGDHATPDGAHHERLGPALSRRCATPCPTAATASA